MKKRIRFLVLAALVAMFLPSCMKTQTYVGDYQKQTYNGSENYYEYYKGRRLFFAKQNIVHLVKKICNGISYKILSYKKNEKSVAKAIDFSF